MGDDKYRNLLKKAMDLWRVSTNILLKLSFVPAGARWVKIAAKAHTRKSDGDR